MRRCPIRQLPSWTASVQGRGPGSVLQSGVLVTDEGHVMFQQRLSAVLTCVLSVLPPKCDITSAFVLQQTLAPVALSLP